MRRLVLIASLLSTACSATTTVTASIVHPAAVPVRSYPTIWVATRGLAVERELAVAVEAHLSGNGSEVRQVLFDDLEPLRLGRQIPPRSAVILLEADSRHDTVPRFASRPETVCGPAGCYSTTRTYSYDVPRLQVELRLTVYDGPSAEVQHRITLQERDDGAEPVFLRNRVVRSLSERIEDLVDQRRQRVRVELEQVDTPAVRAALQRIAAGDWSEGRRLLEALPRGDGWSALDRQTRAKLLYNLGQARRFDHRAGPRRFAAAGRALRAALRLHAEPRYERALRQLEDHRRREALAAQQRETAAANFARSAEDSAIPPPPPNYRR